jgi:hypothetical protein
VINQILGHEKGKSETMTTYTHAINIRTLQSAIEEIKYHIDFSHLSRFGNRSEWSNVSG